MGLTKELIADIIMSVIIFLDIYSKIPQILLLIRNKNSTGISIKYYVLWNLSCFLYIVYCIIIREIPLLIETCINLVLNTIIALLANYYREK